MAEASDTLSRKLRLVIPAAITTGAILAGYLSIIEAFHGQYAVSAALILLACILDMLDGRVARAINATSEFGVEFDSLADMINYGLAPSLLFYFLFFRDWGIPGTILSFLPVCCAGVRLARFNVGTDPDIPTRYFIGLPTTISAVVMAGFVIFARRFPPHFEIEYAAAALTVFVSLLMISEVQYEKSNILSLRYIRKTRRILTGTLIISSMVALPEIAFFAWGLLYIMYGAARSIFYTLRFGGDNVSETETDDLTIIA